MAGTVTPDLVLIHDCDSVADWTGSPTLDTETFIQGTGSLSAKVSKTTYVAMKPVTATDLTGRIIYAWFMTSTPLGMDTKANGGVRIRIEDAAAHWREWYVAGTDTWAGGWTCFAARADYGWDAQSATPPDITAITKIGIVYKMVKSSTKINCWWDVLRHGYGLKIKGGTESDPATFADLLAEDKLTANKYGIIEEIDGIYFLQGQITIGSTVSGEATYFKDLSKIVVFRDRPFETFYKIEIVGNAGATTKVYFGAKSGGRGISGCVFKSGGASKYSITATDTNITDLGLYGCFFIDADTISLPTYTATREVISCSFEACGEVLASTCIVQYCNFINADLRGVRINSTDHHITDSNFIGCPRAINITIDGTVTVTFAGLKFSGNTYDIEKSSPTGDLTVRNTEGSDASTYIITGGGTVTIVTAVTLIVRKVKTGNEPTEYVRCAIYRKEDMLELMNTEANVEDDLNPGYYKATTTVTLFGFTVIVRARDEGWLPFETEVYLTASGLDITAVWIADPNYQV